MSKKFYKNEKKIILKIFLYILFFLSFFENNLLILKNIINKIFIIIDISIIIPIYNSQEYLSLCLNSIINQSLLNIEIICINDGSTDNSMDILRKYKKKDDRIIFFN